MERLTIPDVKLDGNVIKRTIIDSQKVKECAMEIYWRLKDVEDAIADEESEEYDLSRLRELVLEYGLDQEILEIIRLLTKESGLDDYELSVYFKRIEENPKAALIKLADRLHNSSTLYTFSNERMKKYLRETKKFMIPMASYCKKYYPEYNNAFCILKNNIEMLNSTMMVMLEKLEEGAKGKREEENEYGRAVL